MAAFVSTIAGGVVATLWLLLKADGADRDRSSATQTKSAWNTLGEQQLHAHDRHNSWSARRGSHNNSFDNDREVEDGTRSRGERLNGAEGQRGTSSAVRVNGLTSGDAKMAGNGSKGEDSDGGATAATGDRKCAEDVEHEWPVFGSDGIGGRFGAF